jgi:hypothetical protein
MSMHLSLSVHSSSGRSNDLETRLARLAASGPGAVNSRLEELDNEWSSGRAAKGILSIAILLGTILTITVSWWWMILTAAAGLFLLQYLFTHVSILASLVQLFGYRPRAEIEHEKFALRTLRGDFRLLPTLHDIEDVDDITRLEGEGGIVLEVEDRKVDARDAAKEVLHATTPTQSPA